MAPVKTALKIAAGVGIGAVVLLWRNEAPQIWYPVWNFLDQMLGLIGSSLGM